MTTRPSVLHFTTTGAIAGTEQAVLDLSEAHDRHQFQVSYATLFPAGEMNRKILANGAPCYALNVRSAVDIPAAAVRLALLIRRLKVDVLHTHLLHAGLVGVFAAKLSGNRSIKLVHTRHHSDELHRFGPPIKAQMDRLVARSQQIVCANSLAARAVLINLEGISADRIRLTYPGVHLERLRSRVTDPDGQKIRNEIGCDLSVPIIASIAHLLPKKGHAVLLQAFAKIHQRTPGVHLVIAGKGPARESLENDVREMGLSGSVHFLGYRDDIPDVISACDLLVQPSLEEAFGLSMVEGMALGKPVVGSNVGGIPEVILDGKTGILVEPGDVDALANAVERLVLDRERMSRLGEAGKERAERLFTIPRLAADYQNVWKEVLA